VRGSVFDVIKRKTRSLLTREPMQVCPWTMTIKEFGKFPESIIKLEFSFLNLIANVVKKMGSGYCHSKRVVNTS